MKNIEINGEIYQPREQPKTPKMSKVLIAGLALFGGLPTAGRSKKQDVDIVEEYKLIIQKKSKLSRNERDAVAAKFKRMYRKITLTQNQ